MKARQAVFGAFMLLIGMALGYGCAVGQMMWKARKLAGEMTVLAASSADPFEVRITGSQFQWHFHYPGADGVFGTVMQGAADDSNPARIDWSDSAASDDRVTTQLVMPVRTPILLHVTSVDVIHGVNGLQAGAQQDAIPGKEIPMFLHPEEVPRSGELRCGQLCGVGHDRHRAEFQFVEAEDFERWMAAQPSKE